MEALNEEPTNEGKVILCAVITSMEAKPKRQSVSFAGVCSALNGEREFKKETVTYARNTPVTSS